MKITNLQKRLFTITNELELKFDLYEEFRIDSYYEYDYKHDIEIVISSKLIDSTLTLYFDRDLYLKNYEVKGRQMGVDVYETYLSIIEYSETRFMNTKLYIKQMIEKMNNTEGEI